MHSARFLLSDSSYSTSLPGSPELSNARLSKLKEIAIRNNVKDINFTCFRFLISHDVLMI
ncbi:MAG: hypothetical protein EA391_05905 [Balneolaceae bacterium]|nr:MAG: hypothetical protein EA391_05905 [Balneolaceae bacterium]